MVAPVRIPGFEQGQEKLREAISSWGLPAVLTNALMRGFTPVRYPKDALLFTAGSPADVLFAVLSGTVKIYCRYPGAEPILVELAGPGDVAGYADSLDRSNQRLQLFEARAMTGCHIALFTRQRVVETLGALDPNAVMRLGEAINSRWSRTAHRLAGLLGMSLRQRLVLVLRELADRFGVPDARGVLITPELAQEEVASMIGSSRPMVSKLLLEMIRQGTIAREGRRYILTDAAHFRCSTASSVVEDADSGTQFPS